MIERSGAEVTPQPGAADGDLVPNGLPNELVTNKDDPTWPVLPGSQAVNFVSASPITIAVSGGQQVQPLPLFRVWGDPAWDLGRYWTLTKPETQAKFYADAAVAYN